MKTHAPTRRAMKAHENTCKCMQTCQKWSEPPHGGVLGAFHVLSWVCVWICAVNFFKNDLAVRVAKIWLLPTFYGELVYSHTFLQPVPTCSDRAVCVCVCVCVCVMCDVWSLILTPFSVVDATVAAAAAVATYFCSAATLLELAGGADQPQLVEMFVRLAVLYQVSRAARGRARVGASDT